MTRSERRDARQRNHAHRIDYGRLDSPRAESAVSIALGAIAFLIALLSIVILIPLLGGSAL